MKKILKILLIVGVLGIIIFLSYKVATKIQDKTKTENRLKTIPEFEFLTLNNSIYTHKNLSQNTAAIFIYFNSECDFCQHEAQSISDSLDEFKDVQLLFISTEPIETIKKFSEQYNLHNQQNITFLYDNNSYFSSRFDATTIPYILIYDKNQKLIKKHKGQLNATGLLKALNP